MLYPTELRVRDAQRIAQARRWRLARGGGRRLSAAGRCGLALEVVSDEANERVNLLLAELVLEARHAFAAVLNLLHHLRVGALGDALVVEVRDFQRRAVFELEGAARAVLLVAARADVLVGRARVGQLVGRGRGRRSLRGGRRGRGGAVGTRRGGRRGGGWGGAKQ